MAGGEVPGGWRPGMMMWFGASWGAPANESCKWAETPVAGDCLFECGALIAEGDQGFMISGITDDGEVRYMPIHRACMIESTLGPRWRELIPELAT